MIYFNQKMSVKNKKLRHLSAKLAVKNVDFVDRLKHMNYISLLSFGSSSDTMCRKTHLAANEHGHYRVDLTLSYQFKCFATVLTQRRISPSLDKREHLR